MVDVESCFFKLGVVVVGVLITRALLRFRGLYLGP